MVRHKTRLANTPKPPNPHLPTLRPRPPNPQLPPLPTTPKPPITRMHGEHIFEQRLARAAVWETRIAHRLATAHLPVWCPKTQLQGTDHGDIWIGPNYQPPTAIIEIKARPIVFTGPHDWPHPTIYLNRVKDWNQKQPTPYALVIVSTQTDAAICIPTTTQPHWTTTRTRDSQQPELKPYRIYQTTPNHAKPWSWLTEQLAHKVNHAANAANPNAEHAKPAR